MSRFWLICGWKLQVTFQQTANLLMPDRLRAPMSCNTWADWSETIGSLCYKLLTYFGRQDTGAHGLVCVPSVPETLSHLGRGYRGSGWCNHTNKAGPGCAILAVLLILCIYSNRTPERIFFMCVCDWMFMWVHAGTWYLLAGRSSAEAGGPSRLACVDWLVCEFFRGLLRGPHCSHALMTHGAVSVYFPVLYTTTASVFLFKRTTIPSFSTVVMIFAFVSKISVYQASWSSHVSLTNKKFAGTIS